MQVEHWDPERDGPLTEAALRARLERKGYSVAKYAYPPGTFFETHTHAVDKIDAVLAGQFRIILEDGEVVLGPGDLVYVPRGAEHSAEVVGNEPVVSLDAVRGR